MELSMEVLKSFAALTKDDPPKQEITLWGTAMVEAGETAQEGEEQQNLVTYVLLDGATDPTPVNQVAAVGNGDRVMVQIKNHKATIVGNASHPPDESKDIAEQALELAGEKKILKIEVEHCLATNRAIPEGQTFDDIKVGDWTVEVPEYISGRYYWARRATYWSDETITYSDPYFDMLSQTAVEAAELAGTASGAADDAYEIADNALGKIKTMENHFWYNSGGAHIAENAGDLSTGASQTLSSHGTVMMYNGKLVMSLTGNSVSKAALNFYNGTNASANGNDLMATFNKSGVGLFVYNSDIDKTVRSMFLTRNGLTFYTPDEDQLPQAIFGPSGVNLYALGKLAMALETGSITFYDKDGLTALTQFGSDGAQIGKNAASHMNVSEKEISATADDGTKYFSLLNIAGGVVEARYQGSSQSQAFYAYGLKRRADIKSVTVGGEEATYTTTWSSLYKAFYITISSPTVSGKTVAIRYSIDADVNGKSFTFGTRSDGSGFAGGYSASFGEGHIVTGEDSFASGIGNMTPWEYSAAFGKYNSYYSGLYYGAPLFCVGNGTSDTNRSNALSLDTDGNLEIAGELYARKAFMRMVTSSSGSTVSSSSNTPIQSGLTLTAKGEGFYAGSFFITPGITGYYRVTVTGYWTTVAETVNLNAVPPVVPKRVRWFGLGVYNQNDSSVQEVLLTGGRDASYETRSASDIVHINNGQYLVVIARDEAITGSATSTLGTTKITAELVWPD